MKRLLKLTAIVCTIWSIAIFGAQITGGRLNPDWTNDFDPLEWCGEKLCFMGITPGVASWDEAKRILEPYHIQYLSVKPEAITGNTERVNFLVSSTETGKVDWFTLDYSSYPYPLTLKSIVARFGPPCGASGGFNDSNEIFGVEYSYVSVGISVLTNISSPSWVSDSSYNPDAAVHVVVFANEFDCDPTFKWRGFRSRYDYGW
jgi:hypothetical protein